MNKIKQATQSITWILVVTVTCAIAFFLAQVGQQTGLWVAINNLYEEKRVIYWVAFAFTRIPYGLGWFISSYKVVKYATDSGYLWFKPIKSRYRADDDVEDKDYSLLIVMLIAATALLALVSELAIMISTGTEAPWSASAG